MDTRSSGGLAEELAHLATALHDEPYDVTIERILGFTREVLGCAYAGIMLLRGQATVETVAATHPEVEHLDRIQLEHGEGPDLEVLADQSAVLICDTTLDERWPRWSAAVAGAGIRSMLGVRLCTASKVVGSLNAYHPTPDHFTEADVDVAGLLARHAAVAMESAKGAETLWKAIDARNLVGQAQGILMERFDLDGDQAFTVLRRYSQTNNVRLHDVAAQLIETRSLPS